MQSNSNSIKEGNNDNNGKNLYDMEKFQSIFGNFLKQMNDLNNFVALGPFTPSMNDPDVNLNAFIDYGSLLLRFQSNLNLYLSAMINAYFLAINKAASAVKNEMTSAEFRKITINSFEEVFTSMYESPEYSMTYNNLVNSIIDLNKSYQKFLDMNPVLFKQIQQQFTKEEKDLLFYNLHEIKKISLDIKRKLNENKNE